MTPMVFIACVAVYGGLLFKAAARRRWRMGDMHLLIDPMLLLLTHRRIVERIQPLLAKLRLSLAQLNGGSCSRERVLRFTAESVGIAYIVTVVAGLLAVMTESDGLIVIGVILAVMVPYLRSKELTKRVAERRQRIIMELPELLGKLLLLVGAGETVMRALARCAEQRPSGVHPLYDELHGALAAMKRGESMVVALEEMGRRCAVPEVKLFASTLLINTRRGGDTFVPALKELTRMMWEKRKAAVRTLGEQASSKLVFPLVLIFLCIMLLVGSPAVFMF